MFPRFQAVVLLVAICLAGGEARTEERRLYIGAPESLVETGFLKHLLPRFSLKHGVPITVVAPGEAVQAGFEPNGTEKVFSGGGVDWALTVIEDENPHLERFLDWLASDAGARAIEGFAGPPAFAVAVREVAEAEAVELDGDLARGAELSLLHCGRCHVIGPQNAMNGVGSTPSFAVLRTLGDWMVRFDEFYVLKPHPSFTQIEEVTTFPDGRTPTIAPVVLTLEELEDITAYAASIAPADLGAPIKHQ